MKNADLTIMLTLRGRHLHTLRWLWHANRTNFPYHVIVADGEVHPTIDRLLSDPSTFRNLSFEYLRYRDITKGDFYRKCAETVGAVRTKYAMMSDNDDFAVIAGIQKNISFLNSAPDYVCAGGRIANFSITPNPSLPGLVIGKIAGYRLAPMRSCRDISFDSPAERVLDEIDRYQVVYYNVYRTEALKVIFDEVVEHDFSDFAVHEYFCALRALTLGKVRLDPSSVSYLRQDGTSMLTTYWKDWVHHLLRSKMPQDFRAMADTIARAVKQDAETGSDDFKERILNGYAVLLRHMLGHTMMRHRFPKLFRIKQKLLPLKKIGVPPAWYQRLNFWRNLSNSCTDSGLMTAYRKEFVLIEDSLNGDGFMAFLDANAPDLRTIS